VRATWDLLTAEFNPLELCTKLAPLLDALAALKSPMSAASPVKDLDMGLYLPSLKQVRRARGREGGGEEGAGWLRGWVCGCVRAETCWRGGGGVCVRGGGRT
jgi:hypothetical protein